jgi:hypothetical protein
MTGNGRGRSQTWKTFLRNTRQTSADGHVRRADWGFKRLYGIVIMRLDWPPGVDLGVLFAELDRGSQKPSETEFVAVGVS